MITLCLSVLLTILPLSASGQESSEAYNEVKSSLAAGVSHEDIIRTLMAGHDMGLSEATVFALVSGGEANRVAFSTAGIDLATSLAQAQGVATAIKATAGETGAVAAAVDIAMDEFIRTMPQPDVYENKYSPMGSGDVSTST
jgi:hypothetical protein